MDPEEGLDFTKLKYALYARKSTTDETRQVRSIPDQIYDCEKLARHLNLNIIGKPLIETKSAKKPGQREVFNQMLKDIRTGKYDGILAWNPDRLARNMKEGGEIIDMIDNKIVKDLKFATHHFTRDANGLMLLGMSFVLSKQYSDDLSQKVTRGTRRKFSEGQSSVPKHGYVVVDGKFYEPDGNNFELIKIAWEMRKEGTSIENILEYLIKNNYTKLIRSTGRRIKMTKQILSDLFHDPFYYGILIQANQKVDLKELYKDDFEPATTEEVYNQVQALSVRRLKAFNTKYGKVFYPLKKMIICSFCNHNMVVGPSKSHTGQKNLYYRCDNALCIKNSPENRIKKTGDPTKIKPSIRAKVIFNFIYDLLKNGLGLTEKDYNDYYGKITKIADSAREKINIEIHSKQGKLKVVNQEIRERSLEITKPGYTETVKKIGQDKIAELEQEKEQLDNDIGKLKNKVTNPEEDKLSIEQFLNLSKNAGVIVQSANQIIKDQICREIFLNLTVDEEKVLSYQLKPHFEEMIKYRQSTTGRG